MKRLGVWIAVLVLLSGCSAEPEELRQGMELRGNMLQAEQFCFQAEITADYGEQVHCFSMDCTADAQGNVCFTVTEPDSISGISGQIAQEGGTLRFDDTLLCFELLTDDQLSPVAAPWILVRVLRSGYLRAACKEEERVRLTIDDSYEEDALTVDVWLDEQALPERGEILYDGRRILTLKLAGVSIV